MAASGGIIQVSHGFDPKYQAGRDTTIERVSPPVNSACSRAVPHPGCSETSLVLCISWACTFNASIHTCYTYSHRQFTARIRDDILGAGRHPIGFRASAWRLDAIGSISMHSTRGSPSITTLLSCDAPSLVQLDLIAHILALALLLPSLQYVLIQCRSGISSLCVSTTTLSPLGSWCTSTSNGTGCSTYPEGIDELLRCYTSAFCTTELVLSSGFGFFHSRTGSRDMCTSLTCSVDPNRDLSSLYYAFIDS